MPLAGGGVEESSAATGGRATDAEKPKVGRKSKPITKAKEEQVVFLKRNLTRVFVGWEVILVLILVAIYHLFLGLLD